MEKYNENNIKNNISHKNPIKFNNDFEFRGNPFLVPEILPSLPELSPNGSITITESTIINHRYEPVRLNEKIEFNDSGNFSIDVDLLEHINEFKDSIDIQVLSNTNDNFMFKEDLNIDLS